MELNYYKSLWVRWAFADMKVLALFGVAAIYGVIVAVVYSLTGWILFAY